MDSEHRAALRRERKAWVRRQRRRAAVAAISAGSAMLISVAALAVAHTAGSHEGATHPSYFDLPRLDAPGRVKLAAFRGRPVVVSFFASWCGPCQAQLPAFGKVATELGERIRFVAVDAKETGDAVELSRRLRLAQLGLLAARDIGGELGSGLHDALGGAMPLTAFYGADGALLDVVEHALSERALRAKLQTLYPALSTSSPAARAARAPARAEERSRL